MKKRIKQIIGVIIGIIIGISTTVGATTIFNSKDITYSSDKTSKTNVKDSLDELYNKTGKCPEGKWCYNEPKTIADKVELGDYIRMTPTSTSYTPPSELTGCSSDINCTQNTLNPSELNLWRVIKKNDDGTIDMISVYMSSKAVYIGGTEGYKNYIGALNTIAAQYTNEKYVKKTRNIGYSNQIEYCESYEESSCPRNSNMSQGDFTLVKDAFSTPFTTSESGEVLRYWFSSRTGFTNVGGTGNAWACPTIGPEESCTFCNYAMLVLEGENLRKTYGRGGVRPILTLKSDVKIKKGDGKSESTAYLLD